MVGHRAGSGTLVIAPPRCRRVGIAFLCSSTLALACLLVGDPTLLAHASADLSGAWAEMQVLSEYAMLPLVGEVARRSVITLRTVIEQEGDSLLLRRAYCGTDIDNGSAIALTAIPGSFLASLGEVVTFATLETSDACSLFVQPWTTEVRGAVLVDPENEPLPTLAADPRVIDQDGDGMPGLTVHASVLGVLSGDVYVVQRVRMRLVGTVVADDRIEGLVEWSTEQVTLGATSPLFLTTLPSRPDPETENSFFVLIRIDPVWTCAEILAQRAALFGALSPR
jgi:hypothetical protein